MTRIICNSKIDSKVLSDFSYFNCFTLKHRLIGLVAFPPTMFAFGMLDTLTGSTFILKLFTVLGFALPILYVIFYIVSLKKQILRFNLQEAKKAYTVELCDDGIHVKNETEKAVYAWTQIYRIYITKKYMYVYITKNRSFIMPYADLQEVSKESLFKAVQNLCPKEKIIFFDKAASKIR